MQAASQTASISQILKTGGVVVLKLFNQEEAFDTNHHSTPALAKPAARRDMRRTLSLRARDATRYILADTFDIPSDDIAFRPAENGPPKIKIASHSGRSGEAEGLSLSFGYGDDQALVALGYFEKLGVDIERCGPFPGGRKRDFRAIRSQYFEIEEIGLEEDQCKAQGSEIEAWVRHEAIHKAHGFGLEYPAANLQPILGELHVTEINAGPGYIAAIATSNIPQEIKIVLAANIIA